MRRSATEWLEMAIKIRHYRRDVLPPEQRDELNARIKAVRLALKEREETGKLKLRCEELESTLRTVGGRHYPKTTMVEYVEFFLVAAIVILGLRTYVVQPFKIPTNSMWPSYNGMTGQVYPTPEDEPGVVGQTFNFITQLASTRRVDAPISGPVSVPLAYSSKGTYIAAPKRMETGRKWGIIPTQMAVYEIYVGSKAVSYIVPSDFKMDKILLEAYFPGRDTFPVPHGAPGRVLLNTGKTVQTGERILAFDILSGDQLFVDRMSYHFVQPSVGDGFVFRTDHLDRLHAMVSGPEEQYYIKRLVGRPGDTLEIQEPALIRNGEPITGSDAFAANAAQEGGFPGYSHEGDFPPGQVVTVPEHRYMAFGDNSADSLDGRYWGSIPEKDVVGRPLFIYYPFTKRWGIAP